MSETPATHQSPTTYLHTAELLLNNDPTLCPKCRGPLTEGLGACEACGYCRAFDEKPTDEASPTAHSRPKLAKLAKFAKFAKFGSSEFQEMLGIIPPWMWLLLGGVGTIIFLAIASSIFLAEGAANRAFLGMGLLWLSGGVVLLAHILAFRWTSLNEVTTSSRGRFSLYGLWRLVIASLPDSRWSVNLLTWGFTGIISAVFIVGGWGWWIDKILEKPADWEQKKKEKEQQARAAGGQGFGSVVGGTQDKGGESHPQPGTSTTPRTSEKDERPTAVCSIVGYQVEGDRLTGLVLARVHQGRMVHVGIVRGFSAPAQLLTRLTVLKQDKAEVSTSGVSATWVRPELFCEVHHSGIGNDGRLDNPKYKGIVDN